jgi:sigma-B regulation protein RsbU (phosphoserine phosphatase)
MAENSGRFPHSKVLLVEDNQFNRDLVVAMLASLEIARIECAVDGQDGLERLATFVPDLIILDIMMPRMDGFEFLRRIQQMPAFADIPILVTSALDEQRQRLQAFDLGASDYLSKPLERREFAARVSVQLRNQALVARLKTHHEQVAQDMEVAASMQRALLPSPRDLAKAGTNGIHVEAIFQPYEVIGGDLWGMLSLDGGRLCIYVVDFTGHGIPAAINTFRLHKMVEDCAGSGRGPGDILTGLNRELHSTLPRGQFAVMICAVLDGDRLTVANAGAPPPLLWTGNEAAFLPVQSHPLAVVADAAYSDVTVPFPEGSALLIYSDGLSEACDDGGGAFGEEGVRRLMGAMADSKPLAEAFCKMFGAAYTMTDDITTVLVRREPPTS